jgi:hypothetical protein
MIFRACLSVLSDSFASPRSSRGELPERALSAMAAEGRGSVQIAAGVEGNAAQGRRAVKAGGGNLFGDTADLGGVFELTPSGGSWTYSHPPLSMQTPF